MSGCHNECQTCYGPWKDRCLTCRIPGDYRQIETKCDSKCPQIGTFYKNSTHCEACHNNCQKCTSQNNSGCLSCNSPYFLNLEGICVSNCPLNTYKYSTNRTCLSCDSSSCQSCLDELGCTDCVSGFYKIQTPSICTLCDTSSQLQYIDNEVCEQCQENCLRCDISGCLECKSGYTLENDNSCSLKCDINCASCSEISSNCTSCASPSSILKLEASSSTNYCFFNCDKNNEYFDSENKTGCLSCDIDHCDTFKYLDIRLLLLKNSRLQVSQSIEYKATFYDSTTKSIISDFKKIPVSMMESKVNEYNGTGGISIINTTLTKINGEILLKIKFDKKIQALKGVTIYLTTNITVDKITHDKLSKEKNYLEPLGNDSDPLVYYRIKNTSIKYTETSTLNKETAQTIEAFGNGTKTFFGATNLVSDISISLVSIFTPGSAGMMIYLKQSLLMINHLKFINLDFGDALNLYFESLADNYRKQRQLVEWENKKEPKINRFLEQVVKQDPSNTLSEFKSSGKLSRFDVPYFMNLNMFSRLYLYSLSYIISSLIYLILLLMKKRTTCSTLILNYFRKFRFTLFNMLISNYSFYGLRTLLSINPFKLTNISSKIGYISTLVCGVFILLDLFDLFQISLNSQEPHQTFQVKNNQYLENSVHLKQKDTKKLKKNKIFSLSYQQKIKTSLHKSSKSSLQYISKFKSNRINIFSSNISKRQTTKSNFNLSTAVSKKSSRSIPLNRPKRKSRRKISIDLKDDKTENNKINEPILKDKNQSKRIEGFNFIQVDQSKFRTIYKDIKQDKIGVTPWTIAFLYFIFIFRLFFHQITFLTLQNLPILNIGLLISFEIFYFTICLRNIWKWRKIYSRIDNILSRLIQSSIFLLFYCICILGQILKFYKMNKGSLELSYMAMILLVIATIYEMIYVIYRVFYICLMGCMYLRKSKKEKNKANKEDKLDEEIKIKAFNKNKSRNKIQPKKKDFLAIKIHSKHGMKSRSKSQKKIGSEFLF